MSKVQLLQPRIRFSEFNSNWNKHKIGSVLGDIYRSVELLDNELYQLVTVKRRNEGVVPRSVIKGKNILVKNYFTIKSGDFLISKRQVVHGANGIVPGSLDNAVVSNEYLVVTDSQEVSAKFWNTISKRPEIKKLYFISSYGVDIEKLVFDIADWKERYIIAPKLNEQRKITYFFQNLDEQIKLNHDKYRKFQQLKKAMLSNMFPKSGEKKPELRFPEFKGNWERKKLHEVASFYSGLTYSPNDIVEYDGTLVIRSSNVQNGQLSFNDNIYVDSEVAYCSNIQVGDIIVVVRNGSKALIGKHAPVLTPMPNTVIGAFMTGIRTEQTSFLNALLDTSLFQKAVERNLGATINQITTGVFKDMEFDFPTDQNEQAKIGEYFQNIDRLIALQQQKINKLKNIQQACLGKMFV
ncbi:restriction endonuclease subunit S [Vibrio parahaemolyticus]|nr:restriction endonuclease subunit S [Vibrio parahaemolyticus]